MCWRSIQRAGIYTITISLSGIIKENRYDDDDKDEDDEKEDPAQQQQTESEEREEVYAKDEPLGWKNKT